MVVSEYVHHYIFARKLKIKFRNQVSFCAEASLEADNCASRLS